MNRISVISLLTAVCLLAGNQNMPAEAHRQAGPAEPAAPTEICTNDIAGEAG